MKIAVFVSKNKFSSTSSGARFIERLNKSQSKVEAEVFFYEDVIVLMRNKAIKFLFDGAERGSEFELVYLRGISYAPLRHALASYFKSLGVQLVNTESLTFQSMTKLEQNVNFALAGVPIPDGVYVTEGGDLKQALSLLEAPFPLIAKSIAGRNGTDNELVASYNELLSLSFGDAIIQSFVPNNFDYRVVVAGETVLASYRRIRGDADTGHKNNISQGGTREFVKLPEELASMAVAAARSIGRELTGVDILTNNQTGESVVLEANFNFGTPDFEKQADEDAYYLTMAHYFKSLSVREQSD